MTSTVFAKIQMRRGTAAEWATANPILAEGEFAFEIDTGITKVGEILKRMEKGEDEMLAIRNFGKKSLDELVEKLRDKNYLTVPGVDLSAYMSGNYKTASELDGADDE